MKIVMIGTGYVGLVSGACFSEFGFEVSCVDLDEQKIKQLNQNKIPIYEPGLEDVVVRNAKAGRLSFTTDLPAAVSTADVVFIAVGTPTRRGDGHADLSYVYEAARQIALHITGYTVVITKSTVPVGAGRQIQQIIAETNPSADFDVASNPEFLREGSAITDFMRPDRVVVGAESSRAIAVMQALYRPLYLIETPVLVTGLETAELIKYAANAFLAVKISYINQIADMCEAVGANVHDVAKGMGLDKRIGAKFLHPGPGYGGSCFPKDTLALVKTAETAGIDIPIVASVVEYNDHRKMDMAQRVISANGGDVAGRKIALLGLAFKPETDDMRESPAINIANQLVHHGAKIVAFDPVSMHEARSVLPESTRYCENVEACIEGADCAVIITEWNQFRALTAQTFLQAMTGNIVVDLRNIYNPDEFLSAGIEYYSIGRPIKHLK